ncbi:hypothetical protein [Burkholderia multivorans]|uniref:hypothetical protein n=1 Tax=Burkholderia multivorans TaxID=87883 RepID=UPI0013DFFE96|nr:hypothetical protein [Burkholderia multivorans]MBU9621646.1 hypothetical protein [Burkholderia multivorans]NGM79429.1 hypothetical protein [Burkholderia multivorans]
MSNVQFSGFFKFTLAAIFLIVLLAALLIGGMAYIRDDGGDAACPNLSTSQMRGHLKNMPGTTIFRI